jgi:hypothetical protein
MLRYIPASTASIPINWARVPEVMKNFLLNCYGYWENETTNRLPETIAELAKMFDETKFFGYFEHNIVTVLMDISEFGLQAATAIGPTQVGPRFYMTYLDEVWFILFAPGKRDCIVGHSGPITRKIEDYDDYDETAWAAEKIAMAAEETAMAKEFDVKLELEVSQGMAMASIVDYTKKLGGWEACTAQSILSRWRCSLF